ncbi:MAG: hypothetical protein B7733_00375 [Myxococcales bacterium FL481]|nr:MAG: hypothetical protein B7733_00375 [Myxococcales bacterium FL481]
MPTSPDTRDRPAPRGVTLDAPRWIRVEQLPLIRREIREVLPAASLRALLTYAEVVVEGGRDRETHGSGQAYATVMLTIDLSRCASLFRDRCDAATAARLVDLMAGQRGLQRHLIELAHPELQRWSEAPVESRGILVDVRVRAEGTRVYVDGDAMVGADGSRRPAAGFGGAKPRSNGGSR